MVDFQGRQLVENICGSETISMSIHDEMPKQVRTTDCDVFATTASLLYGINPSWSLYVPS